MDDLVLRLPSDPVERLAALQQLQWRWAGLEVLVALVASLSAAADLNDLFADVGDAPAPPAGPSARLAAAWAAALSLHLRLVTQLVLQLGPHELGLEALAINAAAERASLPPGPAGSVLIEEVTADVAPGANIPVEVALAAALYGADVRLQRPWAAGQVAAAAQELLLAAAGQLAPLLARRDRQAADEPLLREVSSARAGADAAEQPVEVQELLVLALPAALARLRPVLAAKVEHARHRTARLEPYTGPGNFERCVAAGQLAWLACSLWALQHLAAHGQPADLRQRGVDVLAAARRALKGCSEDSWPAAAAAAIEVVGRLEGADPGAQAYHEVMSALLDEGELGAHATDRAAAWLAAAPPLFPRLGLQLVAHFSRLMPLLLGWCGASRRAVRAAALEALLEVVQLTWQRMGAHAAVIWRVLRRVHAEELELEPESTTSLPGGSQTARLVAARAEDCALALWFAAGPDFQVQLMTGKGGVRDQLLQAVMQRLENSAAEEEAAEGRDEAMQAQEAA